MATSSTLDDIIKKTNTSKPSDIYVTADRTSAVKLRIGNDGISAIEAVSVPGLLKSTVEKFPDSVALCYKDASNDAWKSVTFR